MMPTLVAEPDISVIYNTGVMMCPRWFELSEPQCVESCEQLKRCIMADFAPFATRQLGEVIHPGERVVGVCLGWGDLDPCILQETKCPSRTKTTQLGGGRAVGKASTSVRPKSSRKAAFDTPRFVSEGRFSG